MRDVPLCLPLPFAAPLAKPLEEALGFCLAKEGQTSAAQQTTTAPPAPTSRPLALPWDRRTPSHHHASIHGQGPAVPSTGLGYRQRKLIWRRKRGRKRQDELNARCSSSTPSPGAVPASRSQHYSPDLTSVFTYVPKTTPSSKAFLPHHAGAVVQDECCAGLVAHPSRQLLPQLCPRPEAPKAGHRDTLRATEASG